MALEIFRLDNQIALVTGGGRGIGFAIAQTLVDAGVIVLVADIDRKFRRRRCAETREAGPVSPARCHRSRPGRKRGCGGQ